MGRATGRVITVATGAAVALALWFTAGWGGESVLAIACNYGSLAFAVFATAGAVCAAVWSSGRLRSAWIALAVAVCGWIIGSALWTYYELFAHVAPFPSWADAGYLLFPVGACIGLALFPVGHSGHSHIRVVLDGLIVAAALFQISWVTVIRSVYEAGGASRFAVGLSLAYPVGDLIAIMVALLLLARARTGHRRTLTLLALGVILMGLSDSAFVYLTANGSYQTGGISDVGWIFGLLVIGVAGLLTRGESSPQPGAMRVPSKAAMVVPYIPIAVSAAVCAPLSLRTPGMAALFASTAILVVAVLVRQYFVVRENRQLLEVVADQALRDPLTGLANRALFNDRLDHAMQLHERDGQAAAVLSLDLDDFKLVNDNLGHPAGDTLLKLVADRIAGRVRPGDTVARLGGDEFAVLMEGSTEQARVVAHRVISAFDRPFAIDGRHLLLRPSVGLALATPDDAKLTADELLKHADVAMYSAKRSHTGGVHTFDAELHMPEAGERSRLFETSGATTVELLGQLRHAIDHVGLSLVYQPKYSLDDGRVVGAEALVRWPHPERGLLGPDDFLPLVREHGLMRSLTDFVLARALDDVRVWQRAGFDVPVAVNVFAPALRDLELPERILAELDDRALSPEVLTVEITEDLLLEDLDRARTVLGALRERGIRVAIDDFGSGYSTLGYLCELPIDEVKLDRKFIAPILHDLRAEAIVRAVVDLAHVLGMTTVAEGVENAATATRLREYGCDVAQGFHYSVPLTAAALGALLAAATPALAPTSARSS